MEGVGDGRWIEDLRTCYKSVVTFESEVTIARPLADVVALFEDTSQQLRWMDGLVAVTALAGSGRQNGAVTKLTFRFGKRSFEMTETVIRNDLPRELVARYEASNVVNEVVHRFEAIEPSGGGAQTRSLSRQTFTFTGVMMRTLGWAMTGTLKKQTQKYQMAFKAFAENAK